MVITTRPQAATTRTLPYVAMVESLRTEADGWASVRRSSVEGGLKLRSWGRTATLSAVGVAALAKVSGLVALVNPALGLTGLGMLAWSFGRGNADLTCLMSREQNAKHAREELRDIQPDRSVSKLLQQRTEAVQYNQRTGEYADLCVRALAEGRIDNRVATVTLAAGAAVALLARLGAVSPELFWPALGVATIGLIARSKTSGDISQAEEAVESSRKIHRQAGEWLKDHEQKLQAEENRGLNELPERVSAALQSSSAATMVQREKMLLVGSVRLPRR